MNSGMASTFDAIRSEADRLVDSPDFETTPHRRQLLHFLVEETCAGRADKLNEITIGSAVFGRDDNYDPQTDPIVRLEVRKLSRELDRYFLSDDGNGFRISIPPGKYVPEISQT
jgi:hypothetical protein